jgi:hypothetical protein
MEKTLVPPAKRLRGPAGLDAVVVDGCAFVETVAQKMPRPPLFHVGEYSACKHPDPSIVLFIGTGRVIVANRPSACAICGTNNVHTELGEMLPNPPKSPRYTGPITPSMWAVIRRHWQP